MGEMHKTYLTNLVLGAFAPSLKLLCSKGQRKFGLEFPMKKLLGLTTIGMHLP